MPSLGDVVSRYHRLMEQNGFLDAAWAEDLQLRMRRQRLTDSGRLLSPVLRPCFVTQKQVDVLTRTAAQVGSIFDRLESILMARPALLNRLQILPAEKSLLAISPGYKRFSMAASLHAGFEASTCSISGVDACCPAGLAYADTLANIFLELPIINEIRRSGLKVSKIPGLYKTGQWVKAAWSQFGGKGKPAVAVVDWAHSGADGACEGELLAGMLAAQGMDAKFTPPEKLVFQNGELSSGNRKIDLVLRRILARELLTRWDLNHPLLEAYRSRAVCVVNSFRSEIAHRRAFLELLTDQTVTAELPSSDRKVLAQTVRWTRVLFDRKVQHNGEEVSLLDFVLKNREHLTLLPDQPAPQARTYAGSEMTSAAWGHAVRQALRSPYVVQECGTRSLEPFPFFQYGELTLRNVDVTLQAQLLNGELGDCMAALQVKAAGSVTPLGIAPVLLVS